MKRLLILVFVLTMCFAGCKEEPKTPIAPETKPHVEVEAPAEEIPLVTESQNPTKETNLEYVTINIEMNGKTTTYSTVLEKELFNATYTPPIFSNFEDFNFGKYGLFVAIAKSSYSAEQIPIYARGLITSQTKDINEALRFYDSLNDSFQISTSGTEQHFEDCSDYSDLIEKSQLVYVSEEADTLGIASVTDGMSWKNESRADFFARVWNGKYDICDINKNILRTTSSQDISGWMFNDFGFQEIPSDRALSSYTVNGRYYLNREWQISDKNNAEKIIIDIYPTENRIPQIDKKELTVSIESSLHWHIEDYDGERYLLLRAASGWEKGIFALFLYDTVENNLELLENHASHATLSPDMKYLAYTSPILEEWDTADFGDMKAGFYIKELETGKTVFYSCEENLGMYCQFIAGWVNEEKLKELT